jgi:hypothetical protein
MQPTFIFGCPGHAERYARQPVHTSHYMEAQKAHYVKHLPFFEYLYKFTTFYEHHTLNAILDCRTCISIVFTFMRSSITSTKSPSFCMATFIASPRDRTDILPRSHDCSCYVSRRTVASLRLWLQKHNDLHAHDFVQSPNLWHQPTLADVTCAWSWISCGIPSAFLGY